MESLKKYDKIKVDIFKRYINTLRTEKDRKTGKLKNYWATKTSDEDFAHLFEKVAAENLFLDGETITIQNRGKLLLCFGYQAYKNKIKAIYPETVFDIQLVKKGDEFTIKKESGKVIYSHDIKNPFEIPTQKNISGAYCIIKNNTGEFFEAMGIDEIEQCKKTSLMQSIWSNWYGEMSLKSVIKRGCKRHFSDMFTGVEKLDNEGYEPELLEQKKDKVLELFEDLVKNEIDSEQLIEQFQELNNVEDKRKFYGQIQTRINGGKK